MNDPILVCRVRVEGVVQGVGYRDFTRRWAGRSGVSGWVRNRRDGAVEALIRGAPQEVEAMLARMRQGPPGARVTSMEVVEVEESGEEQGGFEMRATL